MITNTMIRDGDLAQLGQGLIDGDPVAVEELFRRYAPYLRMVVRRQMTSRLRSRFDSHDVVQSVWADSLLQPRERALARQFDNESSLRSFLVRLTLNRFIDFYRRNRASLSRETRLSPHDERGLPAPRGDRPSEVVLADELWGRLLAASPPAYHELLRLKIRGAPLAEIAARTGFHESSVRRILYDLADRFDLTTTTLRVRPAS